MASDPTCSKQVEVAFARATNGNDDDFRIDVIGNLGGGTGVIGPESTLLAPTVAVSGPDLDGYTLTDLELFKAEIEIDPFADFGSFHWRVSGELRFIGAPDPDPDPGALALFASALSCVACGRRSAVGGVARDRTPTDTPTARARSQGFCLRIEFLVAILPLRNV